MNGIRTLRELSEKMFNGPREEASHLPGSFYEFSPLVKCTHCGQWAAVFTACAHCGAPVDPQAGANSHNRPVSYYGDPRVTLLAAT